MKNFKSHLTILSALMLAWTCAAASQVGSSPTLKDLESMNTGNAGSLDRGYDNSNSQGESVSVAVPAPRPVTNVAPMIARGAPAPAQVKEKPAEPKKPSTNNQSDTDRFNKALGMFAGAIIGGALLASGGAAAGAIGALIGAAVGYFIARSMSK